MKITHISDTHNQHHSLLNMPEADVLIHSGDLTFAGSEDEFDSFLEWFVEQPYKYKIFIAGNHDDCLFESLISGLPQNTFYLNNSSINIEGVNFYGLPMFMHDAMSGEYDKQIQAIPAGTNVLISHQPPHLILDKAGNINYGNRNLFQAVLAIKPQYHLFGHIHDAYGITQNEDTVFSNAALLNEKYELTNHPIVIDVTL